MDVSATSAASCKSRSESRGFAIWQGHSRGLGPVQLPQIRERIVRQSQKLESQQARLAGRVALGELRRLPGDELRHGLLAHRGLGRVDEVQGAIGAMRDQADMPHTSAATKGVVDRRAWPHDAPDDVDEVAITEPGGGAPDIPKGQIGVVVVLNREVGLQLVAAEEEFAPVTFNLGKLICSFDLMTL